MPWYRSKCGEAVHESSDKEGSLWSVNAAWAFLPAELQGGSSRLQEAWKGEVGA